MGLCLWVVAALAFVPPRKVLTVCCAFRKQYSAGSKEVRVTLPDRTLSLTRSQVQPKQKPPPGKSW